MTDLADILSYFVSTAGAGVAAWWLFAQIRAAFPAPAEPPASPLARLGYRLLYVDSLAYVCAGLLAGGVSAAASYALALTTGAAFDPQAATALVIATAMHHLRKLVVAS